MIPNPHEDVAKPFAIFHMEESPPICYRRFESKRSASCSFPRRDHGFLHDTGIDVKREPKHPKDMFSWVSALYESNRPLTGLNDVRGMSVYIGRKTTTSPLIAHHHHLRTGNVPRRRHPAQNENDIYVETRLEPAVLADRAQRYLMGIVQWNDEMASMLDNECICQDLLKSSEPILKCYIGLSDSTYSYIAHTPNIPRSTARASTSSKTSSTAPNLAQGPRAGPHSSGSIRSGRLSATSPTRSYRSRRSTGSSSSTEPTRRI